MGFCEFYNKIIDYAKKREEMKALWEKNSGILPKILSDNSEWRVDAVSGKSPV